jgi:hypothetical protein
LFYNANFIVSDWSTIVPTFRMPQLEQPATRLVTDFRPILTPAKEIAEIQDWQQALAVTVIPTYADLQLIERLYIIKNSEEVLAFLAENLFLVPLLLEAKPKIEAQFRNSPVYVEVRVDPEIENETKLVAYISPLYQSTVAFEKFQLFKRTWWLKARRQAQDKLLFLVEYR